MHLATITSLFVFLFPACGKDENDGRSDPITDTSTDTSTSTNVVVKGTLTLDDVGADAAANGLAVGQNLDGAVAFIKGFPSTTAKSDSSGAFTLEVDTNATSLLDAKNYEVFMWYTVESSGGGTAQARFGKKKDVTAETGVAVDIGEVKLTYTMALHLSVKNSGGSALSDCSLSIVGIDGNLKAINNGSGNYDLDYLPPGTYTIKTTCPGYKDKEFDYTVNSTTTLHDWQTVDPIVMEAN